MAKRKKFSSSKFFRELTKTTNADKYKIVLKQHNWDRKYEIIKDCKGDLTLDSMSTDMSQGFRKPTTFTEFLHYITAWAFAFVNYEQIKFVYDSRWHEVYSKFENWICNLAEEGIFGTSEQDPAAIAFSIFSRAMMQYRWASFNCPSFVLSPDLSTMLQHTKLDSLPTKGLKLPYPTLILAPPEQDMLRLFSRPGCLLISEHDGKHQFEDRTEEKGSAWDIRVLDCKMSHHPLGFFQFRDASQTLTDAVRECLERKKEGRKMTEIIRAQGWHINTEESPEILQAALSYVAACMVYATMPDADKILASDSPAYAQWLKYLQTRRKFTKRERKENNNIQDICQERRFYLGRNIKIINRHEHEEKDAEAKGTHASPRLHWRSGHYRRVWHGSGEDRHTEIHWIKPTLVGVPQPGITPESRAGMM